MQGSIFHKIICKKYFIFYFLQSSLWEIEFLQQLNTLIMKIKVELKIYNLFFV